MSGRSGFNDMRTYSSGLSLIVFNFVLNGTGAVALVPAAFGADPEATPLGILGQECLLPGGSVVYASSTGKYTVTLSKQMNFRSVLFAKACVEDTSSGGGQRASISGITGSGGTSPLSFTLWTFSSGSTLANLTNVRCGVLIIAKNGGVGA